MVMFEGDAPVEEVAVDEEAVVDNKKIEKFMKVFNALSDIEQQAVFGQIQEIIGPKEIPESVEPGLEGAPMTEGLPLVDNQATAAPGGSNPLAALQERLKTGI